MIGVIDSKICNIYSLSNMLKKIGADYRVITSGDQFDGIDKIIMPGVGAFPKAMANLTIAGFKDRIKNSAEQGVPILGICLGMQILFEKSDEFGSTPGLGLIPGWVRKINTDRILPHMGWNSIYINNHSIIVEGIDENSDVYFVHSYMADTDSKFVTAYTEYGEKIPAVVNRGNVYGTQFHPEKSQRWGEIIMRNFCFKV